MMGLFKVIVTNEILGNSERIMSLDEIEKYNIVAYMLAKKVIEDGQEHSSGMWTVKFHDIT